MAIRRKISDLYSYEGTSSEWIENELKSERSGRVGTIKIQKKKLLLDIYIKSLHRGIMMSIQLISIT
jgi:hypothetical protein